MQYAVSSSSPQPARNDAARTGTTPRRTTLLLLRATVLRATDLLLVLGVLLQAGFQLTQVVRVVLAAAPRLDDHGRAPDEHVVVALVVLVALLELLQPRGE